MVGGRLLSGAYRPSACLPGNFGPGLTARMDTPFFMMVKGIGIEGTFQRVESVIIALWVFSDLALLNLLAAPAPSWPRPYSL